MWPRIVAGIFIPGRKPLFSSFGEHTAVCGSSVRQAVARPRHRQSVCIHNIHVAATCRPSVLGSATMRGHMWLNKVASVLGPLVSKPTSIAHFLRHPCPDPFASTWSHWGALDRYANANHQVELEVNDVRKPSPLNKTI